MENEYIASLLEKIELMNQEIGQLKYLLDSNDIKYIIHDETDTGELEVVQVEPDEFEWA